MSAHAGTLEPYRAVVKVTPRGRKAIYGKRYLVRCACGWTVDASDTIFAKRCWRDHVAASRYTEPVATPSVDRPGPEGDGHA
jgi:hypothetical protein